MMMIGEIIVFILQPLFIGIKFALFFRQWEASVFKLYFFSVYLLFPCINLILPL